MGKSSMNDINEEELKEFREWKEKKEFLEEILEDYWVDNPIAEADIQRRRRLRERKRINNKHGGDT
jgi:Zn-dependent M16 (insulinase) family peptidase